MSLSTWKRVELLWCHFVGPVKTIRPMVFDFRHCVITSLPQPSQGFGFTLCRRAAAIQIGCGIRWHLRYVESSRNPSGYGSRQFPSNKLKRPAQDSFEVAYHQPALDTPEPSGSPGCDGAGSRGAAVLPQRVPLPGSTSPAQPGNSTVMIGRGTAVVRQGGRRMSLFEAGDGIRGQQMSCQRNSESGDILIGRSCSGASSSRDAADQSGVQKASKDMQVSLNFLVVLLASFLLLKQVGLRTAIPSDIKNGACLALTKVGIQNPIKTWIKTRPVWYIHLGTPCTLYSIARKRTATGVRFYISDKSARFTAQLIRLCHQHGVHFSLEKPKSSQLFKLPYMVDALRFAGALFVEFDCCRFGCTYRKPTYVATNCHCLTSLGKRCQCDPIAHEHLISHLVLESNIGGWILWSALFWMGLFFAQLCSSDCTANP